MGIIVAPQPLAAEEGLKVLRAGGNAIDAAVTTAFGKAGRPSAPRLVAHPFISA